MSGHTQQVIRHLPEENKLNKTRNLAREPYSAVTTFIVDVILKLLTIHRRLSKAILEKFSMCIINGYVT